MGVRCNLVAEVDSHLSTQSLLRSTADALTVLEETGAVGCWVIEVDQKLVSWTSSMQLTVSLGWRVRGK